MDTESIPNPQPVAKNSRCLWEHALNEVDEDVKKTFAVTKTNKKDILPAILRVVAEKRDQSLWKFWRYETGASGVLIVRDLLEKIIRWIGVIQDSNVAIREENRNSWNLFWSPVWFLLRSPVQDVQAFGKMVMDFEYVTCQFAEIEALEMDKAAPQAHETLVGFYDGILHLFAYYVQISTNMSVIDPPESAETWKAVVQSRVSDIRGCLELDAGQGIHSAYHRTWETGTVHRIAVARGLHEELQSWVIGKSMGEKTQELWATTDEDVPKQDFVRNACSPWWKPSCSSLLSVSGSEFTSHEACREALRYTSSASNSSEMPMNTVCVNCSGCDSADEILRHVVAELTLNKGDTSTVWDALLSEYQLRQAVAKNTGERVARLTSQDCMSIILDVAAANPIVVLLDKVSAQEAAALTPILRLAIDNSDNILKVLLASTEGLPEGLDIDIGDSKYQNQSRKFDIRHARRHEFTEHPPPDQPNLGDDLSATPDPETHRAAVIQAIRDGDLPALSPYLHHVDASSPSSNTQPPLILSLLPLPLALSTAVFHNRPHILAPLLALKQHQPHSLARPLRIAATTNRLQCARLLLTHGADPNGSIAPSPQPPRSKPRSPPAAPPPLRLAASRNHVRLIHLLLAHGADADIHPAPDTSRLAAAPETAMRVETAQTPLVAAALNGHADAVAALLLGGGASTGADHALRVAGALGDAGVEGAEEVLRVVREWRQGEGKGRGIVWRKPPVRFRRRPGPPERKTGFRSLLREAEAEAEGQRRGEQEEEVVEEKKKEGESGRDEGEEEVVVERLAEMVREGDLTEVERLGRVTIYHASKGLREWGGHWHVLVMVAAVGNAEGVGALMARREEFEIDDKDVGCALKEAAKGGHLQVVRLLCESGVRLVPKDRCRALEHAVRNGDEKVVECLLEHDVSLAKTREDFESLFKCVHEPTAFLVHKALDMVRARYAEDALTKILSGALRMAARHGDFEVTKILLESDVPFEREGVIKAFRTLTWGGHSTAPAAIALISSKHGEMFNSTTLQNGLRNAAGRGLISLARAILAHSQVGEVDSCLVECVVIAAISGHLDTTKFLLKTLEDGKKRVSALKQALVAAAYHGRPDFVDFLLEEGANIHDVGPVPRSRRIRQPTNSLMDNIDHRERVMERIRAIDGDNSPDSPPWHSPLDYSADTRGSQEITPIHAAVRNGQLSIIQLLLARGADLQTAAQTDPSILTDIASRELDSHSIWLAFASAGSSNDLLLPMIPTALSFFTGSINPNNYADTTTDPDGRFRLATSTLSTALTTGPGAMLHTFLETTPSARADSDPRYALLLQMAAAAGSPHNDALISLLLSRGLDPNATGPGTGYYYGTALQAASRFGHLTTASLLLAHGADPRLVAGRHRTALHAASAGGHVDVVRLLLAAHGAADGDCPGGEPSALSIAVSHGHADVVGLLLAALPAAEEAAAVVNAVDSVPDPRLSRPDDDDDDDGSSGDDALPPEARASALHMACATGRADIVRMLLGAGADAEMVVGKCCRTPLMLAAVRGHVGVVRALLEAGVGAVDVDRGFVVGDAKAPWGWDRAQGQTAVCMAAVAGHAEVVEVLVKEGGARKLHVEGTALNPLPEACRLGHLGVVEVLTEAVWGTEVQEVACGEAMMAVAEARRRGTEVFELLLEYVAADVETLRAAVVAGLDAVVRLLLERGVDANAVNGAGNTALLEAAYHLQPKVLRVLLECGAGITVRSTTYGGPVLAALHGCFQHRVVHSVSGGGGYREDFSRMPLCEDVILALVDGGADLNDQDPPLWDGGRDFGSALSLAAYMGSQVIVDLLLANGADINHRGGCFDSPLFAAVRNERVEIAQRLLEGGVHCNLMSEDLGTPLHYACRNTHQPLVRLLLRHGADPNVQDLKGVTPLTCILEKGGTGPPNDCFWVFLEEAKGLRTTQDDLFAAVRQEIALPHLLLIDQKIKVSERVICEFLKFDLSQDSARIRGVLSRADGGIGATAEMVKNARTAPALDILLQELSPVCTITTELLESMDNLEKIDVLLWYDEHVVPTERVVLNALDHLDSHWDLSNPKNHWPILQLIWERNPSIIVSEEMLLLAKHPNDMDFLMSRASPHLTVTDAVFRAAIRRPVTPAMFRALFCHRRDLRITESVACEAVRRDNSAKVWEVLLEYQPELEVTAELLGDTELTVEWVELMKKYGKTVVFTDSMRDSIEQRLRSPSQATLRQMIYSLKRRS
ncbi:Ankyrin repeat domain-containing protein 17 [Lasiodiplodia theobromae]|uniref:Ankyrin repeat domain-containing protein 17 n=1 Tax=Lasiodiplodia theobromae TaxID=45133 RepID=UPI0015C3AC06|nr:Ankyrin repeat domain-containing protein 17 [Lasiodiplodia theobromae]KAF4536397.1 Ankyrin repeat domain-containing protein 17 [Lasiodiplodia theobromae]